MPSHNNRVTLLEDSIKTILGRREGFRLIPLDQMPHRFRTRLSVRLHTLNASLHKFLVHRPSWASRLIRLSKSLSTKSR